MQLQTLHKISPFNNWDLVHLRFRYQYESSLKYLGYIWRFCNNIKSKKTTIWITGIESWCLKFKIKTLFKLSHNISQEERLRDKPTCTNFCLHRRLMSLAFPFILMFASRNVTTDTELTEQAPSVDSAAAFNSLEIHMNSKSM